MAASVRHLDRDGFTTISGKNWADAFAGVVQTGQKFGVENNGTRQLNNVSVLITQVGTNDGSSMLQIGTEPVTISAPFGVTGVLSITGQGGTFAATGVYGWKVTATNVNGETPGSSVELTVNVDDTTKKVTLSWTTVTGATGYKVYRTSTAGTYTSPTLIATLGAVTTFIDTGAAATAGVPPSTNTTGGWLLTVTLSAAGAGGVWTGIGNQFWRVVAEDANSIEIANSLEATVNVNDVTKTVTLTWTTVTGADHYKVYRSAASGNYTNGFRATVAGGGSTSFVDTGGATTAPSLTNPSSFAVPPVLGTLALSVGNLAVGQQYFYWVNRVIPTNTAEAGNPRVANITIKES